MAFSVIASLTDTGRQRLASSIVTGKSFQVDRFSVGQAGHDPIDPATALTPDPSATACPSVTFGPETIDAATLASQFCPEFTCRLETNEAVGPVSNLCLLGTVIFSPIPGDGDVGTSFLFAIGNFPLRVKVGPEQIEFRVTVQF